MSALHGLATAALRRLDPETAHELTLRGLEAGLGPRDAGHDDPALAVELAGLRLPNPVGLAAGFDKDARAFAPLLRAGFGFVECGSVTPRPQAGNPKPRLFRLPQDGAVINRMGFNNGGLDAFASRLARRAAGRGLVGANLGANKESPDRVGDYIAGFAAVAGLADYVTVNVSSPNTPGLRALQSAAALDELGERLGAARAAATAAPALFLKVAPDLDEAEIEVIAARAAAHRFDALIVSNTTVERATGLRGPHVGEAGGLSGSPLFARSTQVLGLFAQALRGTDVALVGVGGVASGADAYAKIRAGARAVQLYTALIYGGPGLVGEIKRNLAARLKADGFRTVGEAVGAGR